MIGPDYLLAATVLWLRVEPGLAKNTKGLWFTQGRVGISSLFGLMKLFLLVQLLPDIFVLV